MVKFAIILPGPRCRMLRNNANVPKIGTNKAILQSYNSPSYSSDELKLMDGTVVFINFVVEGTSVELFIVLKGTSVFIDAQGTSLVLFIVTNSNRIVVDVSAADNKVPFLKEEDFAFSVLVETLVTGKAVDVIESVGDNDGGMVVEFITTAGAKVKAAKEIVSFTTGRKTCIVFPKNMLYPIQKQNCDNNSMPVMTLDPHLPAPIHAMSP